jgi:hypothetical protein
VFHVSVCFEKTADQFVILHFNRSWDSLDVKAAAYGLKGSDSIFEKRRDFSLFSSFQTKSGASLPPASYQWVLGPLNLDVNLPLF